MSKLLTRNQLIEGIRGREGNVFSYIERNYKPSIKYLIFELGGSTEDANDVYQEGIIRIIEMVDKPDFILTSELSTLLYAICNKIWKLRLEKKRIAWNYQLKKENEYDNYEVSESIDKEIYDGIFWDSFNNLQNNCKTILKALMKGIPLKELAFTLDISYDYIRKKKRICHSYLFELIKNHKMYKLIEEKEGSIKLY